MKDFLNEVGGYALLPFVILLAVLVYAITKWALKQKAVTANKYAETVLTVINETALAIASSLNSVPVGTPTTFNYIKNDVINTAANSILSNFQGQVSKAGLDKLAVHNMLSNAVAKHGGGTVFPTELVVRYKLPVRNSLNREDSLVLHTKVISDVDEKFKEDEAITHSPSASSVAASGFFWPYSPCDDDNDNCYCEDEIGVIKRILYFFRRIMGF